MNNAQALAQQLGMSEQAVMEAAEGVLNRMLRWNDGDVDAVVDDLTGDRKVMLAAVDSQRRDVRRMAEQYHASKDAHQRAILGLVRGRA